jgi:glutamyl-tRNA synthetase
MADKSVRVRFAPSPTGNLHVGGLRTALFNWLFARHYDGTFLIRVEDTDRERSKIEHMQAQLEALAWTGIKSDETPLIQSERSDDYQEVLQKLLSENKVYRCVCTPEEIETRVRAAGITGDHYGYDGFCATKQTGPDSKQPFVIRFAIPKDLIDIVIDDLIRGKVTFKKDQLDDFIIVRSDGSPTYNFVVVVDDNHSAISHIIRGEDHLSNTPKQMLLYQACGYDVPQFAHIPMILGPEGNRLSKRDGAVNVLNYRQEGYLPNALVNYMVRLGWSHGDQEIFTQDELIKFFSLESVGKKSAIFDYAKLEWVNGVYIHEASSAQLQSTITDFIDPEWRNKVQQWSDAQVEKSLEIYKGRVKTVGHLAQTVTELYDGPSEYAKEDIGKWMTTTASGLFDRLITVLEQHDFELNALKETIKSFCKEHDTKLVTVAQPIRIALTGGTMSPGVFDLLALLGKKESIQRLQGLQRFLEEK